MTLVSVDVKYFSDACSQIPFIALRVYFLLFLLQTDLHLHCDEWDKLLSSEQWEPMVILQKLPEFLRFVKEVQGFVVHEMKRIRQKGERRNVLLTLNRTLEHTWCLSYIIVQL